MSRQKIRCNKNKIILPTQKETQIRSNIHWIDTVIGGNHGRGVLRFPMKLIYVMDNCNIFERVINVGYIYYWKDYNTVLKSTIIIKLGESSKKS